ncbi:MAG: acyltransferase 3 [Verrucomicrobiales bacterium]|nr:acyltransferase 3 [Verrucomicrobiales bacterium]
MDSQNTVSPPLDTAKATPDVRFKSGEIPSLNGWRAVAIILVVLDHAKFTAGFPSGSLPNLAWIFFEQGNLGVRMFFVLSGFLITHLLLREAARAGTVSLKQFYLRRSLRILPVYLTYLAVLALLLKTQIYVGETNAAWLGSLTFTRNMVGPVSSFTGHFWSLAVEEQFYLAWPICLVSLALWRRVRLAYGLLFIPILLCPLVRMCGFTVEQNGEFYGRILGGNSILVYADSLAIGCLGAFLLRRFSQTFTPMKASLLLGGAVLVIAGGAFWSTFLSQHSKVITGLFPSLQAVAVLLAMWVSTQHPKSISFRILNWRPIVLLGVLSYSLYIWHVLFLCPFTEPPLRALLYSWRFWWLTSIVVAVFSYYGVERPLLRLKNKLAAADAKAGR